MSEAPGENDEVYHIDSPRSTTYRAGLLARVTNEICKT
jgi:hypothetical protein